MTHRVAPTDDGLEPCGPEVAEEMNPFADGLVRTLRVRGVTQLQLAERLEVTRGSVNDWCKGRAVPGPQVVIAIEKALRVDPGTLSRVLGYIAIDAYDKAIAHQARTFGEWIAGAPELNDDARLVLLTLYEELKILSDPLRRHGFAPEQ